MEQVAASRNAANLEKYDKAEMIPVKCNVHPWMHGNFAVLKNSHYAVSSEDGSFKLPNLPPGKYTVTAWHESYGEKTQDVVISRQRNQDRQFRFQSQALLIFRTVAQWHGSKASSNPVI